MPRPFRPVPCPVPPGRPIRTRVTPAPDINPDINPSTPALSKPPVSHLEIP
jgi:hypothetical protein